MSLSLSKGTAKSLLGSSSAFTALAASGVYSAAGSAINLGGHRKITLFIAYNAAAIGGLVSLIPELSAHNDKKAPVGTDDAWFVPGVWDGSVTAGTLTASSLPAGTDFTVAGDFARCLHRQMDLRSEPADVATDKVRFSVTLNVEHALWLRLLVAEAGVTATPGSVWISYILHS
jgi:hypothetical protein